VLLAVGLRRHAFLEEAVLVQLQEDVLHDLGLLLRRGAAKVVKVDVEPLVRVGMLDVKLVTELLGRLAGLEGLGLGGGSVCEGGYTVRKHSFLFLPLSLGPRFRGRTLTLVCAADVEGWSVSQLAVATEDIGRKDGADDVAQMGDIVLERDRGQ
jgi:hypothetical protein